MLAREGFLRGLQAWLIHTHGDLAERENRAMPYTLHRGDALTARQHPQQQRRRPHHRSALQQRRPNQQRPHRPQFPREVHLRRRRARPRHLLPRREPRSAVLRRLAHVPAHRVLPCDRRVRYRAGLHRLEAAADHDRCAAGRAGPGAASRPGTRRSRVRRQAASSSPARTSSGEPRARATPTGTPSTCPASTPRASSGRTVYTSRRSPSM